jgi:hypothetical protein
MTETGVVGHISGIRVTSGLKGRELLQRAHAPIRKRSSLPPSPAIRTTPSYKVARAEIEAGADFIFTMLNAGRAGVIDALREAGVKQIGNVAVSQFELACLLSALMCLPASAILSPGRGMARQGTACQGMARRGGRGH